MIEIYDRILGKMVREIPKELLFGRWSLSPQITSILIPNSKGKIVIEDQKRMVPLSQIPQDDQMDIFREIALEMEESMEMPWKILMESSPLIRNIDQTISLSPFEKGMLKWLFHIEEICRTPHTYLTKEIEKVVVSRARRVSLKALDYLSAHSEDWERRTFRSVIPKKILAQVVEDLVDIYENRATARLVDRMLGHIQKRIRKDMKGLQKFLEMLEKVLNEIDGKEKHWRKDGRLYSFFKNLPGWNSESLAEKSAGARKTREKLEGLRVRLQVLLNSSLYRSIPKNISLGANLRSTNLLINDQHYRFVRILWEKGNQDSHKKDEEEIVRERREYIHHFNQYALLLLAHSLKDLSFEPEDSKKPLQEALKEPIHLTSKQLGKVTLTRNQDETLSLQLDGNAKTLRLIPIPACPGLEHSWKAFGQLMDSLSDFSQDSPLPVIVFYNTNQDQNSMPEEIKQKLHHFPLSLNQGPTWLPVSPDDIYSSERLSRVILGWLLENRIDCYPAKIDLKFPLFPEITEYLASIDTLQIPERKHHLNLYKPLDQRTQDKIKDLVQTQLRKPQLQKKLARKKREELENFDIQLREKSNQLFDSLCFCPFCLQETPDVRRLEVFPSLKTFRYTCANCDTQWGLASCERCKNKIIYLKPKFIDELLSEGEADIEEIAFGRDILALPIKVGSKIRWQCGQC